MHFTQLGISPEINCALEANRITAPTEIQTKAIPHILNNEGDLVAVSHTGTGKTAAFCLPILQQIDPKFAHIQALVLVPTRELGQQVAREFFLFSKFLPRIFAEAVYGGAPIADQVAKLKRTTHVVVATPGRLLDLLDRNALSLQHLRYVVLDEADEMINMGFKDEMDRVLAQTPVGATKLLFTATMPTDVKSLIREYLKSDFKEIRINANEKVNENIVHHYAIFSKGRKLETLKSFLRNRIGQRGIVFCRTKTDAKRLAKQLAGFAVTADAIHGNLNQEMREKVMRGFKKGRIDVLIATDIAARGIDVKELDYIVHFDLPEKTEQYTHRSGRTARAGQSGISVCLIQKEDINEIKALETALSIVFSQLDVTPFVEKRDETPITIFMNMGFVQGFEDRSLTDYLVEETGIAQSDITGVLVEEEHSRFVIPTYLEQQILLNLKGVKLSHRNMRLWRKE